ncbi:hypothetical protein SUDANB1_00447 [Streptomyces sp. enrichment culture]|uniref:hypothetical protein n=1 Tax=Streptomyces sp. enrichment culture TaxID=1795815 RepID=UPI003F572139
MSRHFRSPLARWGFTVLAAVAVLTAQLGPFLVTAAIAAYAWRCKPRRRNRR